MSLDYKYASYINLHVEDRISVEDAKRQTDTATYILRKINNQPGIILADEVGMGKTFVALAVAASVHFQDKDRRPVVVMIPSSLKEKWPRDFNLFKERCLDKKYTNEFNYQRAEKAEDFLKLLDNPIETRKAIIFLTHGAMSRGLSDGWIKLAIIRQALYRRHNIGGIKKALVKSMSILLSMSFVDQKDPLVWDKLLNSNPADWLRILHKSNIDPENDHNTVTDDDPVPKFIIELLPQLDLDPLFYALGKIPYRKTSSYYINLNKAKRNINEELRILWKQCLKKVHITLPLLIMDEAHHLKNSHTVLASLFSNEEELEDGLMIEKNGALATIFERMLFLTATPFQLGHNELCNVLERFSGISWQGNSPSGGLLGFHSELGKLKRKLDESQIYATGLDRIWDKLKKDDLCINENISNSEEYWWHELVKEPFSGSYTSKLVFEKYLKAKEKILDAETLLRKWVIRHNKQKYLPGTNNQKFRRKRLLGRSIINESEGNLGSEGIPVNPEALLPFLLSARLTSLTPVSRPVFAEGLSSSYEAFMQTRLLRQSKGKIDLTDFDDEAIIDYNGDESSVWYLTELTKLLPQDRRSLGTKHPKISSTVNKVVDLWLRGEKVLVFCHYVATGKALRKYISSAIKEIINNEGSKKLKCKPEQVEDELDKIGKRFLSEETRIRQAVDLELNNIIQKYPALSSSTHSEVLIEVIRRYLRTPSFLVRFFPLGTDRMDGSTFIKALDSKDSSGFTLRDLINQFLHFLEYRCELTERESYIGALKGIQPGGIRGADLMDSFFEGEIERSESNITIPNVRLVNGSTKQETRQKLMLTFNTPFYPDVLIASSVMAEGVDLHLNCRYIIHHDLCWNPSTLEQRTGRVDRIGSKSEKCAESIQVYIPFISETQDEKMYRVVMDRERWFKVVMGESYSLDVKTTDKLSQRIPMPLALAEELSFKLGVIK